MTSLSYPIGQFQLPEQITAETVRQYIDEIAGLPAQIRAAVQNLNDEQLDTPYRPGGWTVRQVIHHVPDSHLNSYIRFHWTLTEADPVIKPYDEKGWASLGYQNDMPIDVSLNLLEMLHVRWVYLLQSLTKQDLEKVFIHPDDNSKVPLKKAIAIYAWHGKHHLAHITSLRERMGW